MSNRSIEIFVEVLRMMAAERKCDLTDYQPILEIYNQNIYNEQLGRPPAVEPDKLKENLLQIIQARNANITGINLTDLDGGFGSEFNTFFYSHVTKKYHFVFFYKLSLKKEISTPLNDLVRQLLMMFKHKLEAIVVYSDDIPSAAREELDSVECITLMHENILFVCPDNSLQSRTTALTKEEQQAFAKRLGRPLNKIPSVTKDPLLRFLGISSKQVARYDRENVFESMVPNTYFYRLAK